MHYALAPRESRILSYLSARREFVGENDIVDALCPIDDGAGRAAVRALADAGLVVARHPRTLRSGSAEYAISAAGRAALRSEIDSAHRAVFPPHGIDAPAPADSAARALALAAKTAERWAAGAAARMDARIATAYAPLPAPEPSFTGSIGFGPGVLGTPKPVSISNGACDLVRVDPDGRVDVLDRAAAEKYARDPACFNRLFLRMALDAAAHQADMRRPATAAYPQFGYIVYPADSPEWAKAREKAAEVLARARLVGSRLNGWRISSASKALAISGPTGVLCAVALNGASSFAYMAPDFDFDGFFAAFGR